MYAGDIDERLSGLSTVSDLLNLSNDNRHTSRVGFAGRHLPMVAISSDGWLPSQAPLFHFNWKPPCYDSHTSVYVAHRMAKMD